MPTGGPDEYLRPSEVQLETDHLVKGEVFPRDVVRELRARPDQLGERGMNSSSAGKPGRLRRLAAIAAIFVVVAVAVGTLVGVVGDPLRVLAQWLLLAVLVWTGWIVLTRTGARRVTAVVVAVAALVALTVSVVNVEG